MKKTTSLIQLSIFLFSLLFSTYSFSQSLATYDILFTSVWNSTDHGTLPSGPHWSKLVGVNHNDNITFLEMGQTATPGIEDVAERGNNNLFENEVDDRIADGDAEQYINGGSLGSATGTISINNLEVTEDFPLLTLVSMIAPSPDWMIAINSVNLRENDAWKTSISIDLFPYDAGTDNGTDYESSNSNNIGGTITSLANVSPFNSQKIGTLTITLKSVLGTNEVSFDNQIKVYPNPSNGKLSIESPVNNIKSLDIYDTQGVIIKTLTTNSIKSKSLIKLQNLSVGLYFLKFSSVEGYNSTKKIIVE